MASETELFNQFVREELRSILERRFALRGGDWNEFINDYARNGTLGSDLARWKRGKMAQADLSHSD